MKKLVKLDENYRLTDIDWKATMRQAVMVQEFIEKKTSYEEREKYDFEFNRQFIIDSVLNKTIEIPYHGHDPYSKKFNINGPSEKFSKDFRLIYDKLKQMVVGYPHIFSLSAHESGEYILGKYRVEKDGELYEWCWFED